MGLFSFSNNARYKWWGSIKGPRFLPIGIGDRILWIVGWISFFPWLLKPVNGDAFGSSEVNPAATMIGREITGFADAQQIIIQHVINIGKCYLRE